MQEEYLLEKMIKGKTDKEKEIIKMIDEVASTTFGINAVHIKSLKERLAEKRIGLTVTSSAKQFIAKSAYDPVYGARPLKRYIQRVVETEIAKWIIANKVSQGDTLSVDFDGEGIVVQIA